MAVKLRLMRMGKTKQPTYRVVAADARSPRNGRFIDLLGTYEPRREPSLVKLNVPRIEHWLSVGAQPTERVQKILIAEGVLTQAVADKTVVGKKALARPAKAAKEAPVVEAPAPVAEAPAEEPVVEEPAVEEAAAPEAEAETEAAAE